MLLLGDRTSQRSSISTIDPLQLCIYYQHQPHLTMATYKQRKEAFVSNLPGGDLSEINAVTFVATVRAHFSPSSSNPLEPALR